MSFVHDVLVALPAFGLGVVFAGAFWAPRAYRRGRAEAEEEQRVVEGLVLAREQEAPRLHPIVEQALPDPDPRAGFRRAFTLRLRRPSWPRWDVLGAKVSGLLGLAVAPIPKPVELAAEYVQREPQLDAEPQPGEPGHPDYPWTVYPLEPGLGDHNEPEEHRAKHAADLTDTGEWLDLVARLQAMGAVDVDPLALPCSHCDTDHVGCVGCACPCRLQEVS